MDDRVSLEDILIAYVGATPDPAKIERRVRVVKYAADQRTPLVIEYEHEDDEGTWWTTQRNLETGETRLHHLPGDR